MLYKIFVQTTINMSSGDENEKNFDRYSVVKSSETDVYLTVPVSSFSRGLLSWKVSEINSEEIINLIGSGLRHLSMLLSFVSINNHC